MILGKLGNKTYIPNDIKFEKPENIQIGDNVIIGRVCWLAANPLTGKETCNLTIGAGCYIGNFAHIYCTYEIKLGQNVLLADRVYIADNSHGYKDIDIPIHSQAIEQLQEVKIGDNSWLGENVCIIGASVGKHCVIGANSVVTKTIPDYCIAVGIPAKIIKRYSFEKQSWLKTDEKGNFIIQ